MSDIDTDLARISDYRVWNREFDVAEHASALVTFLKESQLYSSLKYRASQADDYFFASKKNSASSQTITQSAASGLITRDIPPDTAIQIVPELRGAYKISDPGTHIAAFSLTKAFAAMAAQKSIPFEVFAHTTTGLKKSSKPYEEWIEADKPSNPGRLNSLRHVVFKTFSDEPRILDETLPLFFFDDLLKENIDGEALLVAGKRLIARPEQNKLMLVVGNDMPMDNATQAGNGEQYLDSHLRVVSHALYKHGVNIVHIHPDTVNEAEFKSVFRGDPVAKTKLRYPFSIHAGRTEITVPLDREKVIKKLSKLDQWLIEKEYLEKLPEWYSKTTLDYLESEMSRKQRTGEFLTGPDVLDSVLEAIRGIANNEVIDAPGIVVCGPE